ncbi:hypothetical protein [Kitasatospora sp. NPDC086791]|uniref:hypothetical protein n=1 Tax=Kitasatospora sp. NPDC086791 TaxID=3155178 RepID=UPI003449333D
MPTATRGDRNREHTLISGAYTLTINGIAAPTEHRTIEEATAELRAVLGSLPLAPAERNAFRWFLADPNRVGDYLTRDGQMAFTFTINETSYTAVIRPTG